MTDYTHYERFMTKDEMALRLNIETALRECCESECAKLKKELIETKQKLNNNLTLLKGANANASALSLENEKLKKELEDIKEAFEIKSDNLNRQSEEIMKLRQDYDCALAECTKFATEFNNVTYNYECATKEIKRLREKVTNQKTQLNGVQQALLNRNMTIEALTGENDRLKKEVKERRVVFEPTSYLLDIQAKDEEIKTLRKKNLDLKNENECLKLKYDHLNADVAKKVLDNIELNEQIEKDIQDYNKLFHEKEKLEKDLEDANKRATPPTQPLYIKNLNVTYYANGPIWTNEEDKNSKGEK